MYISDLSVKKPITIFMAIIAISIFGFISLSRLPVDLFPDLEIPVVAVVTDYEGAGPKETEKKITRLIEGTLAGINEIDYINSISREGTSTVMIHFNWGVNLDARTSDVREKLDLIKDALPDSAGTPVIFKFSPSMMPVMMLGLKASPGTDMGALYNMAEDDLKTKLEQVPGIARVTINGGMKREVHVNVSRNRLQAYGLDISRITQLLYAENQNIAGGKVYEGVYKYIVRTVGEFRDLDDIGNIVVTTTRSGIPIKLKEIAAISYGYDEDRGVIRINRQNGLTIQLFKESGENTVLTARAVRKKLKELKNILPANIEFNIMFDSSEDIERAIDSVITVALQGIFFAVIVLMLFLWNIRTVLIIAVSIPTSIIVTFIAMYAFDVNLNIISLSGLALGVGMMVDSSIVVLENIFHFRLKGMGKYSAAGKGARQVALAITASTLTTIVIFVPFLIVEGMVKEIFWDLALTVSISLLASLLVSLTVIPMLSSKMISIKESSFIKPLETRFNKLLQRIDEHYENILKHALHRKKIIVFTTLILTFVIGGAILATIGKESFPENDEGKFSITATFPPGTRLEATDTLVKKMENDITAVCGDLLEVLSVQISGSGMFAAFIGASEYKANIRVRLTPVTEREQGVKTVMEKVRKKLTRYPARMKIRSQGGMQGGAASKFSIEIRGDNLKQGNNIADKILSRLKKVKGIREPEIDKDDQLPEISLHIKRDLASKVGLNASHIANTIRTGFGSTTAGTMKTEDGTDIDIKVRLRKNDSRTLEDILSLSLPTPSGKLVPLASILNTEKTISPAGIKRKDQKRIVTINADIFGRPINEVMDDVKETIKKNVYIPRSFDIVYGGSYKDMQESFADLKLAFILAIVLVYAIMASQFESLIAPFVIMFAVPFGAMGALILTWITGNTFSIISATGIVVLVGIVINNGIVLVDYMNILMHENSQPDKAAVKAGSRRFRPVLMTSLTTILGLFPMALGLGEGAELYAPLSISILGGLAVSTVFTLIIVPITYAGIRKRFPLKKYTDSTTGSKKK